MHIHNVQRLVCTTSLSLLRYLSPVTDDVIYTDRAQRAEGWSQCVQKKSGVEVDCPQDAGYQSIFSSHQRISEGPFQCTLYTFTPPVDGCEARMEGSPKAPKAILRNKDGTHWGQKRTRETAKKYRSQSGHSAQQTQRDTGSWKDPKGHGEQGYDKTLEYISKYPPPECLKVPLLG